MVLGDEARDRGVRPTRCHRFPTSARKSPTCALRLSAHPPMSGHDTWVDENIREMAHSVADGHGLGEDNEPWPEQSTDL